MLAMSSYPKTYIDACRARVDAQVATFRKLAAASTRADKAFEAVEVAFFNNMVIVLEGCFVHRARGTEKKDGNPLNEVRVLAASMMQNGEKLMPDATIKLNPEKSVLGYKLGDKIRVTEESFTKLAKAFFADLEAKFSE